MNKIGLSRPGALQMVASLALAFVAAIGPAVIAFTRPSGEWLMTLTGFPALAVSIAGVGVVILYVVGFLRYCADKGYSKWLGLWLLLGNVFGLIVLLLLPDFKARIQEQSQTSTRTQEMSGSGRNE